MKCINCGEILNQERLEALQVLGKQVNEYTCLKCAPNNKIKGFFLGPTGVSQLVFTDKLGDVEHWTDTPAADKEYIEGHLNIYEPIPIIKEENNA
jgi:hypothetical protein